MTEKEQKIFNYGILVGELETIAEFNNRANHIYEFTIERIEKSGHPNGIIIDRIVKWSKSFSLEFIPASKAFDFFTHLLEEKWFFAYQNGVFNPSDEHTKPEFKQNMVKEFVVFLLESLTPVAIYEIKFEPNQDYHPRDFNHFLFECEAADFHFRLSVTS